MSDGVELDEGTFDRIARDELRVLEDALSEVDPDKVEIDSSDGILKLALRDGTRIVINTHRAARQIWLAAVSTAWHFDPVDGSWRSARNGDELRATVTRLLREHAGVALAL